MSHGHPSSIGLKGPLLFFILPYSKRYCLAIPVDEDREWETLSIRSLRNTTHFSSSLQNRKRKDKARISMVAASFITIAYHGRRNGATLLHRPATKNRVTASTKKTALRHAEVPLWRERWTKIEIYKNSKRKKWRRTQEKKFLEKKRGSGTCQWVVE